MKSVPTTAYQDPYAPTLATRWTTTPTAQNWCPSQMKSANEAFATPPVTVLKIKYTETILGHKKPLFNFLNIIKDVPSMSYSDAHIQNSLLGT